MATADFDQIGHFEPGVETPKARVEVEVAIESQRRLLAQTLRVFVRIFAPVGFSRHRFVEEGQTRLQVGALVV